MNPILVVALCIVGIFVFKIMAATVTLTFKRDNSSIVLGLVTLAFAAGQPFFVSWLTMLAINSWSSFAMDYWPVFFGVLLLNVITRQIRSE